VLVLVFRWIGFKLGTWFVFVFLVMATLGWAILFATIARNLNWSPRTCYLVPVVIFMFLGAIQFVIGFSSSAFLWGLFIGTLCKKLAYPELGWNHADKPDPPLTLFSGRVP
jgi:hypothetical protein